MTPADVLRYYDILPPYALVEIFWFETDDDLRLETTFRNDAIFVWQTDETSPTTLRQSSLSPKRPRADKRCALSTPSQHISTERNNYLKHAKLCTCVLHYTCTYTRVRVCVRARVCSVYVWNREIENTPMHS